MPEPRPTIDTTPFTLELPELEAPVSWPAVFGNDQPVELEVGLGQGAVPGQRGDGQPGHNFLGIELSRKYARLAAERVAKRNLTNVRVVAGDARLFLARYVPPASLRAVHVYFPDPWWKKRHKKRRVFAEPLVADIERGLEPGGDLQVATDVEEYFGVIRAPDGRAPPVRGAAAPRAKDARARPRLPDQLRTQVPDRGAADLPLALSTQGALIGPSWTSLLRP